jgi:dTDP-4-dehydrorhamnose reductase
VEILVTGGTGRLGKELAIVFPESLRPSRQQVDLKVPLLVSEYISENKPDIVIHTAARTSVPFCEENRQEAYETNVGGTENLINACLKHDPNCYFVFVSTACVFRGDAGNYVETDLPYPKNYYALTKLLAESVVTHSTLKHLIVRTNFVAREKWPYPRAFTDRFGTYLFASDVASAIASMVKQELTGVVHVCGDRKMSMFELAKITTPDIQPMTLSEYRGAPLTIDMTLGSKRIKPFKISV